MKLFSANLSKKLVPNHYLYVDEISEDDDYTVCRGKDYLLSRQMLAIVELESGPITSELIEKIRLRIKKKYRGIYIFREIGLQIVVLVDNFSEPELNRLKADKFASGAIIIQGLHFVSIKQKIVFSVNSRWGEVTFGQGEEINRLLLKLINE